MNRRGKYKQFTKIGLSMQYCCFELVEESQEICTIATPHGFFRYKRLPMGIKISGDVAQHIMTKILNCECYIGDVGIWTNGDFNGHVDLVDHVLKRFVANGMKCNPLKCDWAVKGTDFLGHWMTPEGIKP